MMSREPRTEPGELGTVQIAHEVIARIAAIAAQEVPGVVGVSQGVRPVAFLPRIGGVRVIARDRELQIRVPLIVRYGVNLPRVGLQVQERVREAIRGMTDLGSFEVDVSIHGVREPVEKERAG